MEQAGNGFAFSAILSFQLTSQIAYVTLWKNIYARIWRITAAGSKRTLITARPAKCADKRRKKGYLCSLPIQDDFLIYAQLAFN